MKIGIITFHFVSNQGAALQCYALQTYLTSMQHDVMIINYRPRYHVVKYSTWKNPFLVAHGNWRKNNSVSIGKRLYIAARGFTRGTVASIRQTDKAKYEIFRSFTSGFLNQTKEYRSLKQLQADPPTMDVYISGSDQLWNTELLNYDIDGAYFLDFGVKGTKRLTYAVSPKEHYTSEELSKIKKLASRLDAVCLREDNSELSDALGGEITIAIDPTLLLEQSAYEPLVRERLVSEPYVFVYGLENSKNVDDAVKVISSKRGLKIINGTPNRTRLSVPCKKILQYGPREFLSYIKYADYVVTNSFHGTAFSIIYRKPFVVAPHSTRGKRMEQLLERLGISERMWRDCSCPWENEIPYGDVEEHLVQLQNNAKSYFENNL